MKKISFTLLIVFAALSSLLSCVDKNEPGPDGSGHDTVTREQLLLEKDYAMTNTKVYLKLISKETTVVRYIPLMSESGTKIGYRMAFHDGDTYSIYYGKDFSTHAPALIKDKDGGWAGTFDKGKTWIKISSTSDIPQLGLDNNGNWTVAENHKYKPLTNASGQQICGFDYAPVNGNSVFTDITASTGTLQFTFIDGTAKEVAYDADLLCSEWQNFVDGNENNVLLDFSYAGYGRGEIAPPENSGYKQYDITKYGAVANDGKSDREAFIAALTEIMGTPTISNGSIAFPNRPNASAVLYFPEGEYILHSDEDDITVDGKRYSRGIIIRAGNFIIKGAGRDKTTILMTAPNQPTDPKVLYSSPDMILLTHWSSFESQTSFDVTGDAAKGSFSLTLGAHTLKAGDWVCLHIASNDQEFVDEELSPFAQQARERSAANSAGNKWSIIEDGAIVNDYHKIKSVNGSTVTFHEPIMHEVKAKYGWKLYMYPNHTNVGVEDIKFKGNAKEHFKHHGSWEDDGAYKPISMNRLTDSWIRRCTFESTSEAASVTGSANVSVYDIVFSGNRGHSSIRSAGSSRVFIGKTVDNAHGDVTGSGQWQENTGNYHAVGVSKPSMGAVLWRNTWGNDSCFESHATQPRATLIDCCRGGWMRLRMGGAESELPNHLSDLTIWNFEMTAANTGEADKNRYDHWIWWGNDGTYARGWSTLPPIVVGFHGVQAVEFDPETSRHIGSNGITVQPESLYEAQLKARLGYVPAWLEALK